MMTTAVIQTALPFQPKSIGHHKRVRTKCAAIVSPMTLPTLSYLSADGSKYCIGRSIEGFISLERAVAPFSSNQRTMSIASALERK